MSKDPKLWVTGEALIDFVPIVSGEGRAFAPRCGGSPFNVAKAAARQGADVGFLGAISTDMFGDMLASDLGAHGVDIAGAVRVDRPTTLAFVDFDGSDARYAFYNSLSATQLMDCTQSKVEPAAGDILHAGSISLIDSPGADSITEYFLSRSDHLLTSIDPNVRLGMIKNIEDWRIRIESLLGVAGIVKLSDEDLASVAPGQSPREFADRLIAKGTGLVVVTFGPEGAMAKTSSGNARVPAVVVDVIDTVGAGDTVMGTLLADLAGSGLTTRQKLSEMGSSALESLMRRCLTAAALNCATSGCNPPSAEDTDEMLRRGR